MEESVKLGDSAIALPSCQVLISASREVTTNLREKVSVIGSKEDLSFYLHVIPPMTDAEDSNTDNNNSKCPVCLSIKYVTI